MMITLCIDTLFRFCFVLPSQMMCTFSVPQKYSEPKAKYGVSVAKKKPPPK